MKYFDRYKIEKKTEANSRAEELRGGNGGGYDQHAHMHKFFRKGD